MNSENQELILLTGKMLYQLQQHEKSGNPGCLKTAYAYMEKAEAVISKMDTDYISCYPAKMFIVK